MSTETIKIIKKTTKKQNETIEKARILWTDIAKKSGWYKEPFYVQVWIHEDGSIDTIIRLIPKATPRQTEIIEGQIQIHKELTQKKEYKK